MNKPIYQKLEEEQDEKDEYSYAVEVSLKFTHIKSDDDWKIEKTFKTIEERNEYLEKMKNKESKYFKYRKKNLTKEKKDGKKRKSKK